MKVFCMYLIVPMVITSMTEKNYFAIKHFRQIIYHHFCDSFFLQIDKEFWRERVFDLVKYAALNPYEFIFYVVALLSPFFLASAILSYKLAKQIEAKERAQKREDRRKRNIQKAKATKAD